MAKIDVSKIAVGASLTIEQSDAVKESLRGKISAFAVPIKNDYVSDSDRGTIKYDERNWNYSFHKVVIPDGTVVEERNFSQKDPHTQAISGKNLTFKDCNLSNVEIDPSWTLIGCMAIHQKRETVVDGVKTFDVQYIEIDGKFVENSRAEVLNVT